MPDQPLLELEGVSVVRDGRAILDDVSLTIQEGEHVAIFGPNGSGKSTLVKILTREIYPHAGRGNLRILGEERALIRELRTRLSAVSADQALHLLGDPSVAELVLSGHFGTYGVLFGYDVTPDHEARAKETMRLLEIDHLAGRPVSTLSSGEGRRAWIARALVTEPCALVLDEPTSNLDVKAIREFQGTLRRIAASGVTLILVTHHLEEIVPEIGRVVLLKGGKIFRDGKRQEVLTDENLDALFETAPLARASSKAPQTPKEYLEAIRTAPVYDVAIKSPLQYAPSLSKQLGNEVWLKREDMQPVFSFKLRGAYALMARLPREALDRGVIAASAGNHAQGVALAANRLGAKATIVVPRTTPSVKTDAIKALGADLVLHGDSYDDAHAFALKECQDRNLTYVHPYDQPEVIAGQGTVGLEIADQAPAHLDAVFVAVGGGGLISGVALALKQLRPGVKVIGVEPEDSDAMHRSLEAGKRITLDRVGLLADGVAVRTVGEETFRLVQEWVDEIIVVSNDEICAAVKEIFEDRRAVLEPSGALAFAGLKRYVIREGVKGQNLVTIACGANLNFDRLRYVAERAQVGERREGVLAVRIPERPGSFREFCTTIGNRSITEFNYRYGDSRDAVVFAGVAIAGQNELDELVSRLADRGYETFDLTGDELATTHLRHMVGGRSPDAEHERLFHFDFPERAGALGAFLERLGEEFNISLFHYRNHGADRGRVLVGFQVPPGREEAFDAFRNTVGYVSVEVTENIGLQLFLR